MRKIVPFVVAGVIVVGGAAAFFMTKNDKSSDGTSKTSSSASGFDVVSTAGQSYRATISTEGEDGNQNNRAVMEADAKTGAVRYQANTASESMTMIYTKDAYYVCQGDSCFKYALGQGTGASFNPDQYQYDDSKIENFKTASTSLGRESCPAGTCDVWKVTTDGSESKVYVDTKTKKISQVTQNTGGVTSKVVYEYVDVTVEIPANAQEAPSINLPSM